MGGEAIKALRVFRGLKEKGQDVELVTHERVKRELSELLPNEKIYYIKDSAFGKLLWRLFGKTGIVGFFIELHFQLGVKKLLKRLVGIRKDVCVHYVTPITPCGKIFPLTASVNISGPLNGNLHYPPGLRNRETKQLAVKRNLYLFGARISSNLFSGMRRMDLLLVSGGARTIEALKAMGCDPRKVVETLDGGVDSRLAKTKRREHCGENLRFVFFGRLVALKGADLAVRSLCHTKSRIELDIIGSGPEEESLKKLTRELGLEKRVSFLPYMKEEALFDRLHLYRAFVFLSYQEAFGLSVQESMIIGLPTIALKWGGPEEILKDGGGILIEPRNAEYVINETAKAMDFLALNGEAAEELSQRGRVVAEEKHVFSRVIDEWICLYENKMVEKSERERQNAAFLP